MKIASTASSTICALLIGGCSLIPQSPTPRVSLARHACQIPGMTPVLFPDQPPQSELSILTGGTIKSGDFALSLWLYCDQSLSSDDPNGADYSEVRYMGLRYEWSYYGPMIDETVRTVVTANNEEVTSDRSGPGIDRGGTTAHTGQFSTPNQVVAHAIGSSRPVEFVMTVSSPDTTTSIALTVTFDSTADGIVLATADLHER